MRDTRKLQRCALNIVRRPHESNYEQNFEFRTIKKYCTSTSTIESLIIIFLSVGDQISFILNKIL